MERPIAPPVQAACGPSRSRVESNVWLREVAARIEGDVLSIGSRDDLDGQGGRYRDYFYSARSYLTSDVSGRADLVLDVRHMAEVPDGRFSCVFCSGVLEHVDDFPAALSEITRILSPGGVLLLGVPFRQPLHDEPGDFWRFTRYAIEFLLRGRYSISEIREIDADQRNNPAAYWTRAVKR